MNPRKRKLSLFLFFVLTGAIAVTAAIVHLNWRAHISEVFTTQRPGESKIVWHTMLIRWERGIIHQGNAQNITATASDNAAIYAIAGDTVSRIDKASGDVAWTKPLSISSEVSNSNFVWNAEIGSKRLIAFQIPVNNGSTSTGNARITCLNPLNGTRIWELALDGRIASAPAVSGSRVMIPLTSGEMLCVDISHRALFWRRQVSLTHYAPYKVYQTPVIKASANPNVCIVRAGSDRFVALDPETGETLWSRTLSGTILHAEEMDIPTASFTLNRGALYVSAMNDRIAAWDVATGRVIWRHKFTLKKDESTSSEAPDGLPLVTSELVLTMRGNSLAALHRSDGSEAWDRLEFRSKHTPSASDLYMLFRTGYFACEGRFYFGPSNANADVFYTVDIEDPVISRSQQTCRSLPGVLDLIALNIKTGKENWRWQLDIADNVQNLIPYEIACTASQAID